MYLEHYGLSHLPFQITPDVRFFFESHGHTRARATIIYGLSKNEGFVVVTGAVGAGKTTLLEHLLAGDRFEGAVVARVNTTQLGAENLLALIAHRLGLEQIASTKAGLLRDLESFLLATRAAGKRTLLIVDEVQNLSQESLEELRMLSNFQDAEHPLLQTLLVGQPEFRARLAGPDTEQIRQRVIASYHLAPLAPEDVPAYIAFRLKHAGYTGAPIFTPDALGEIAAETGGVPRKINRLCDRALLYGFLEDRHELDGPAVAEVIQEMRAENLEADPALAAPAPPAADGAAPAARRVPEAAQQMPEIALDATDLVDTASPVAAANTQRSEAAVPRADTGASATPEAAVPEPAVPEAAAPEPAAPTPEAPGPESLEPESPEPEAPRPKTPEPACAGAAPATGRPGPVDDDEAATPPTAALLSGPATRPFALGDPGEPIGRRSWGRKPVLIAANGQPLTRDAGPRASERAAKRTGTGRDGAPPTSAAADAPPARDGTPTDPGRDAPSAGEGAADERPADKRAAAEGAAGDPAELSATIAHLRRELAGYKVKITRLIELLSRDGAGGAPRGRR
jgi:putative secretion ATPase (PEP-CTERM system associated)